MLSRISWFTLPPVLFCKTQVLLMTFNSSYSMIQTRGSLYLLTSFRFILHIRHDALQSVLCIFWVIRSPIIEVDNLVPHLNNGFRCERDIQRESVTTGSLPPGATNPSTSNFEKTTSWWRRHFVATQSSHKGGDIVRFES